MRVGRGDDEASAHTAAAFSTSVPPFGQAVAIQKALSRAITTAPRTPATAVSTAFVFGS